MSPMRAGLLLGIKEVFVGMPKLVVVVEEPLLMERDWCFTREVIEQKDICRKPGEAVAVVN